MKNLKWFACVVLAATAFSALTAETHCPGNVASVPLRQVNRYQMIVKVSVNHSGPYDFLLDTGTQVTIVDPSLADGLHLGTDGSAALKGVGFHESASMARLDVLAIGAHEVSDQRVLVTDLARMKGVDLHIQGILGGDFLEHFDMLIDNAHRILCLDEADAMSAATKGQRISLIRPADTPEGVPPAKLLIADVRFSNGMRPVRLMLDSGSNTPFFYAPSEYLALGVTEGAAWHGRAANGEQQAFVALPPQDMKIGGVALSKVLFLALRDERKAPHSAAYDGLLPT